MSELSAARQLRQADSRSRLRLIAIISVLTGIALLAGGAFLLSYARIHEMALFAGVSPSLAALYPLMFDITLVIACVAAVALRGARRWMRGYAVLAITILLAVVAVGEAVHSAGIGLPYGPAAAAYAVMPWALFLIGFSLGLLVLRHLRTIRIRARAARAAAGTATASNSSAVILPADQRIDRPRPQINDLHAADAGVSPAARTPATLAGPSPSPGRHPGTLDVSSAPAHQHPGTPDVSSAPAHQHPGTPDVTSAPASEHRHGHAHRHHHRAGDDATGCS